MKKIWLLFLLLAGITIFAIWTIWSQSYPIASVNSQIISAGDFNKDYAAALTYYKNAMEVYKNDPKILEASEIKQEIKRALLSNLIENILIDEELEKEIKFDDLKKMTAKRMEEITNDQKIQKAAETLYGFSFDDFKERVLAPQAKKEILQGRLFLKNENFEDYFNAVKLKARVMIFLSGFDWNGKEVIIKRN